MAGFWYEQQKVFGRRPGSRTADGGGEVKRSREGVEAVGFLVNKDQCDVRRSTRALGRTMNGELSDDLF
ncbi:hypothetical protein GQ457_13G010360 [Hibiscus cannabinus]